MNKLDISGYVVVAQRNIDKVLKYNAKYLKIKAAIYFLLAKPSQDVFLLRHVPQIGQSGRIFLIYYLC